MQNDSRFLCRCDPPIVMCRPDLYRRKRGGFYKRHRGHVSFIAPSLGEKPSRHCAVVLQIRMPYPAAAVEVVVNDPEALPGIVAPVGPTHQVLDDEAHVYQGDFVVWGKVTLQQPRKESLNHASKSTSGHAR